jgi:hypothetical protein
MAHIDSHPAGDFCWIELGTTDQNAAKGFYGPLFGWTVNDIPIGPGETYSMFKLDGRDVGAAYTLRSDQVAQGVPPHWMVYVAVDSADDTARRAAELGGATLAQPFDVFDVGRMAVLRDPTGAVFCVWQAKSHKGTGIAGVHGTFCWGELSTPDPARASGFYSALFGWRMDTPPSGYVHIVNGEESIGGILPLEHRDPNVPPHWLSYFAVSDCDAVAARANEMGAKLLMPPMTMEKVGRLAVIADPQGAVFALYQAWQNQA